MSESYIDSEGRVTTMQTVQGSTLAIIETKARQQLRAFFAHHAYEIIEIRARPQLMYGGEVAYWEADVEARMGGKTTTDA